MPFDIIWCSINFLGLCPLLVATAPSSPMNYHADSYRASYLDFLVPQNCP